MAERFIPVGDKVLLLPIEGEDQTKSGLFVPENAKERPNTGMVLAVGQGKYNDAGVLIPLQFKEGQKVGYSKYGGNSFKQEIDGDEKEVLILSGEDIFGIIETV